MPAGRPKGSEGANRREARAVLKEKYPEWHPLLQMADIANDADNTKELQFQAAKEVQSYLMPKLKAIEHTGVDGEPLQFFSPVATDADL